MEQWLGLPSVAEYQGLNLYNLSLNSAYVIANTTLDNVFVYSARDLCYECPFNMVAELKKNEPTSWVVDTSEPVTWRIMNNVVWTFPRNHKRGIMCEMRPTFSEYGVYGLDVGRCETKSLVPTYNSYLPFLLFLSILFMSAAVYAIIKYALKCKSQINDGADAEFSFRNCANERPKSLHFYRGILLLLLIFITSGAGGYPIFRIKNGGLSIADCLFFVYAWTIGIKIPLMVDEALQKEKSKWTIFGDIFIRAFILILLGITIDSTLSQFPLNKVTLWRPLEVIGASYLAVGSAYLLSVKKMEFRAENIIFKMMSNLMSLLWCWIISGFILATMIILIATLTSYNCIIKTPLTSTENTYSVAEPSMYCNNDFTKWINFFFTGGIKTTIFVDGFHGFSGGILGLLSTILASMIGLKAGIIYLHYEKHAVRTALWALWGLLFCVGAIIFAAMSVVVQCNLWPISSILFITSSSYFFLISVYVLTEYYNHTTFITTLGNASLPILSGHLLFSNSLPFLWPIVINNHSLYLVQNIWTILLWVLAAVFLKRNKISFPV